MYVGCFHPLSLYLSSLICPSEYDPQTGKKETRQAYGKELSIDVLSHTTSVKSD
jgi:hypothetical protein